jgi:hypothetical protein
MYSEIPQGRIINIQGLNCSIPEPGYVYNHITKLYEKREIAIRNAGVRGQYWERLQPPSWYKDVLKKEDEYLKKKKEDEPPFYDERYEQFKRQEWDRRLNGYWLMIYNPHTKQDEPVYLTGFYYMLLQWFSIDVGYPDFMMPHLLKTYFLQYCIEDPVCMGMIDVTKRRFLKTFIGGLFILEYITRTKMVNGAIQSKTGNDAKKVFGKAIVYPFRKFPRFFRPEYDMSLGVNPKTEMRFQQTNVRGKKAEDGIDRDELGSAIDWGSADPVHYDGQKIHRYFGDEYAKTTEANVFDRHEVVRYCLLDEKGKIIGKALYSSTVEKLASDKDGVQEAARQLWDASDQNRREANGMTQSGLYRFFQTADEGRNFDIYGYPDVTKTIEDILSDRESVRNNVRALSARMKKEPRTEAEAWSEDADKCVFNIMKIDARESHLKEHPIPKRNILFYRNGESQKVGWRDVRSNEDFYWKMSPDCDLNTVANNKSAIENGQKVPGNKRAGAITIDSYSNSQGGRKYGSKASAWLGIKKDGVRKAVGWLYGRPDVKEILHEQVMLCAEYFGFMAWYEHTSDDYLSYFRERGRVGYLGMYPWSLIDHTKKKNKENVERFRGTPITPFSLTKQLDKTIYYFEEHIDWIDFEELFPVARKFDPYNRTEYDAMVSFQMLVTILDEPVYQPAPLKAPLIQVFQRGQTTLN